jgi:hypothetical protein
MSRALSQKTENTLGPALFPIPHVGLEAQDVPRPRLRAHAAGGDPCAA